jgi:hypothetical protein
MKGTAAKRRRFTGGPLLSRLLTMHTYRAYRLDNKRRFKTGCWIEAQSDKEARRKAAELCEPDTSGIEIWRDSHRIDEIACSSED